MARVFTERSRRVWAATEARALGYGGIGLVERATRISRATIQRGLRELEAPVTLRPGRTRRAGGGRKPLTDRDPTFLRDLDALVEPTAPGVQSRRSAGPVRASASWRLPSRRSATRSATRSSPKPCTLWAIAGKATRRRARAVSIRIATPSSGTSLRPCTDTSSGASPVFPWIRRRRSWSAISRTAVAPGARRAGRAACACMTS